MDATLRRDLACILLEECFVMREPYALALANGKGSLEARFRRADVIAWDYVNNTINRIEARCSKLEG